MEKENKQNPKRKGHKTAKPMNTDFGAQQFLREINGLVYGAAMKVDGTKRNREELSYKPTT